jgi:hypothetical protein
MTDESSFEVDSIDAANEIDMVDDDLEIFNLNDRVTQEIGDSMFPAPTHNSKKIEIKHYRKFLFKGLLYNPINNTFTQNNQVLEWKKQKGKYPAKPETNYEYNYVTAHDVNGVRRKIYKDSFKKKYDGGKFTEPTTPVEPVSPTITPEVAIISSAPAPVDTVGTDDLVKTLEQNASTGHDEMNSINKKLDTIISMLHILGKIIVFLK